MKKIKLENALKVYRGASLAGKYYSESGKYIRLTLGNFNYPGGGFKANTSKSNIYFTGPISNDFILHKGDIITPLTEQVSGLLGETARIPEDNKYIQSGDIGLVKVDETKMDKTFAYYLLQSPSIKRQLGAAAQQTKIRHTSPEKIESCEVYVPETIEEQRKIGKFLDAINIQISNNNSSIKQLDTIIRTSYDYWFLQYDFPDENGRPYRSSGGKMVWNEELKREIPEGWEVKTFGTIFDVVFGTSPKGETLGTNNGGIEFYQGSTDFGKMYPTPRIYTTAPVRYAKAQDVLLSVRAPVGAMNLAMNNCCIGRGLAAIHHDSSMYAMNTLKTLQPYFDQYNQSGTTFGALTSKDLMKKLIIAPPDKLIEKFTQTTQPMEKQIRILSIENHQLASLRDFLLPLLMNGQVTIKDAEDMAGKA